MADSARSLGLDLRAVLDDDVAFRAWFERTLPRVYAYLLSRSGSRVIAEDLTQEVFLEAIRSPATFDGRSDSLPWLIGIARHRLAYHARRHARDQERHERLVREVQVSDPQTVAWQTATSREATRLALRSLPSLQRIALVFRFQDQLSVRAVARELGRSEDATESLIRRARQAFERRYREVTNAD